MLQILQFITVTTMKKSIFTLWMLALTMILGLTSCSEKDDNPAGNNDTSTEVDPGSVNKFNPEILAPSAGLFAAQGVDADLKQAFIWGTNPELSAMANVETAEVYVLNKLTDIDEGILKKVLTEDLDQKLVCVVNPVKAEFEAYAQSHEWFDIDSEGLNSSVFIYGFNGAGGHYFIYTPESGEGGDPIVENMNRAQNYYAMISAMLSDYNRHINNGGNADSDTGLPNMENFASHHHFLETHTFSVNRKFRQIIFSDADIFSGSFSMSATYDIYMVHVYEGEPGAGDYYGVKMTASIASANMWKGKGWYRHGGTYVRWCGAYCKNFIVESHLISNYSDDDRSWMEDTSDHIIFPAGAMPSPLTTNGSTTVEDKNSFSLKLSQSVGGTKGPKGLGGKLDFGFSEGWEWSHSEKREINDVDVVNEKKNGNWARWRLQFNNLPEFQWSQDYGFNIKSNQAARGTMDIQTSWMWYDKNGKDNEDRTPYTLCTWMSGEYAHQSFITTKADLDEIVMSESKRFITKLPKMVNTTAGRLKIVNNMPDGMTISNIKVITTDNKLASEFEYTVPSGGEKILGAYDTHYQYTVTFVGRTTGGKTRNYKFTLNPSITLNHKSMVTIYAASDFTAQ